MHIVGVEGFSKYRYPAWELYDEVIEREILATIRSGQLDVQWDLINTIEVIEHFSREDATELLRWMSGHAEMIMYSFHNSEQGAAFENELERHRGRWNIAELQEILPGTQFVSGNDQGAYLCWRRV